MKILIIVAPYISHYNAIYTFAKEMTLLDHQILFVSESSLKSIIINDFEFIEYNFLNAFFDRVPNNFQSFFNNFRKFIFKGKVLRHQWNSRKNLLDTLLKDIGADVIFVDNFMPILLGIIKILDYNVVGLETMINRDINHINYPLNCGSLKKNNSLTWFRHFIYLKKRYFITRLSYIKMDNYSLLLKEVSEKGILPEKFFCQKSLFIGVQVKELILTPKELDPFYLKKEGNMHCYLKRFRKEKIDNRILSTIIEKKRINRKIIYCSFGTLFPIIKPKEITFFFKKLIECSQKHEAFFIVSTGELFDRFESNSNLLFVKTVPQLWLLNFVDLFITHGGINSVIEAIESNVPMLLYPFDKKMDQFGNAARIELLQVGIVGRWSDSSMEILSRIDHVFHNSCFYLSKINELRNKINVQIDLKEINVFLENDFINK